MNWALSPIVTKDERNYALLQEPKATTRGKDRLTANISGYSYRLEAELLYSSKHYQKAGNCSQLEKWHERLIPQQEAMQCY